MKAWKMTLILILVLTASAAVWARPASAQAAPAPKTPATQSGTAQPTAPKGKLPPQAKTQPEFDAYNAAMKQSDAAAIEKAANEFAAKYPDSELRILLYRAAMHAYQAANNADKMQEMGRKVLTIDPDDPEALTGVAEALVERTRDTDLDKDKRLDDASAMSQRALATIDTDVAIPAGTPQEKVDAYKSYLRSSAYSIAGTVQFNRSQYADAEASFRKSIDAFPSQPDPVVVLRLALALDKQAKYADALKQAYRAVELTQENTTAGGLARRERDRLIQLTGGIAPAPSANPPADTTQKPPSN